MVIVMHWSFVTMFPQARGRVGDRRGNEWGFDQSFLYIGKKGCEMKR